MKRIALAVLLVFAMISPAVADLTAAWVDNSGGTAMTTIERVEATTSPIQLPFAAIADVGVGITTFRDAAVIAGVNYCYRVKAHSLAPVMESSYSETVCAV